jgi:hypothetical protein
MKGKERQGLLQPETRQDETTERVRAVEKRKTEERKRREGKGREAETTTASSERKKAAVAHAQQKRMGSGIGEEMDGQRRDR